MRSWPRSWRAPSTSTAPKPCEPPSPTGGVPEGLLSPPSAAGLAWPGPGPAGICPARALGRQQLMEDSANSRNCIPALQELRSLLPGAGEGDRAAPPTAPSHCRTPRDVFPLGIIDFSKLVFFPSLPSGMFLAEGRGGAGWCSFPSARFHQNPEFLLNCSVLRSLTLSCELDTRWRRNCRNAQLDEGQQECHCGSSELLSLPSSSCSLPQSLSTSGEIPGASQPRSCSARGGTVPCARDTLSCREVQAGIGRSQMWGCS